MYLHKNSILQFKIQKQNLISNENTKEENIPKEEQHLYFNNVEVNNDQRLCNAVGDPTDNNCVGMRTGDTLKLIRIANA